MAKRSAKAAAVDTTGHARNANARETRRVAIVRGLVNQQPARAIAAQIGISRATLYNELQQPETQALIRSWMQPHHNAIKRMIPRALAAVHTGLKPSNEMRDRLAAVKTLGTVMDWAEGRKDGDSDGKPMRWQGELTDLLAIYAKIRPE